MAKIVVLGATGYAGGLALESLAKLGQRPLLAGQSEEKLAPLAQQYGGLDYQTADASNVDSVRKLVEPGDVLVTTVGPFSKLGVQVAAAAALQGAHYIDSTGEVAFVRDVYEKHHEQAKSHNAVMLPAFGNDYVPGILAAGYAMRDGREQVRSLEVGYFMSGETNGSSDMSQGTRKTMLEGLTLPSLVYANGQLEERRTGGSTNSFEIHGTKRNAILASGTEVLFLPTDFPQLESVTVYNGWAPGAERIMPAASAALSALGSTTFGRNRIESVLSKMEGPPGGPDAEARARTGIQNVAIARDGSGQLLSQALVEGPNAYTITGDLMAWAAIQLADGNFEAPGVVGPIEAFGFDKLAAACAEFGMVRTA